MNFLAHIHVQFSTENFLTRQHFIYSVVVDITRHSFFKSFYKVEQKYFVALFLTKFLFDSIWKK